MEKQAILIDTNKGAYRRAMILGLDGTPYSFIKKEIEAGNLPYLAGLARQGQFAPMMSEIPTISSVAWASFMTGKNPGEHGIFGFTDRKPGSYDLYFPNYSHLKAEPFWDGLSREGKRCCVLNVPSTYPARPLNGILVSGFVAPSLERATYPAETFDYLKGMGYRIDVDAAKGRESLDLLLEDLHLTLEKRREAFLSLWQQERWDLFVGVFTGTDRLHHFFWRQYEENHPTYHGEFLRFYRRLDEIIGELTHELDDDTALFMLSDHGFCSLKKQVYLNHFLREQGLLNFSSDAPRTIADIDPERTQAYCMDPGRIYLNLKDREPAGIVNAGPAAEALLARIESMVMELRDPDSGEPMVDSVARGSDLYTGPQSPAAPDLVVVPKRGYDFKGSPAQNTLTDVGPFTGMHTHDDAMVYVPDNRSLGEGFSVRDYASLLAV